MMLTITYLVAFSGSVAGCHRWCDTVKATLPDPRLLRMLVVGYWILGTTMLACGAVSLAVIDYDPGQSIHRTVLLCLAFALIPQAAIFAFVFTPLMKRGKFKEWTFSKLLIATECVFVIPIALLIGFNLMLFFNAESVAKALSR